MKLSAQACRRQVRTTTGFSVLSCPSSPISSSSTSTTPNTFTGLKSHLLGTSSRRSFSSRINNNNSSSSSSSGSDTTGNHLHSRHDRLIVVGSGVAGSAAALIAAEVYKIPVTLMFAGNLAEDCNSWWAQGGIIYRNYDPASGDSAASLARDIHRAGAGLCVDDAVRKVSEEGPGRVRQLLLGGLRNDSEDFDASSDDDNNDSPYPFANVPFDRTPDGELSLCLEASHAAPRILHYADHTGMIITKHITQAAAQHPLIQLQPNTLVTDVVKSSDHGLNRGGIEGTGNEDLCLGVATLDRTTGERSIEYATHGTVLASGGLAGIYEHSTNPAGFNALGSSVALATRAGVHTQDLEYVQFHPTALYMPNEARFLLTEALRGEGAVLRDASGRAFAKDFHPDGELAPRDIVARGVFEEAQKIASNGNSNQHNVFLDITHRDADWLHARFPTIQAHIAKRGLDLAKDPLPITPAAHYTCGGVTTDMDGRTSLDGLYAAGEAARTGLHGGNRLASTSLLEGLVYGASVADFVGRDEDGKEAQERCREQLDRIFQRDDPSISLCRESSHPLEPQHIQNTAHRALQLLGQVRRVMWDHVGLVRTPSGLSTAVEALEDIKKEATELHQICPTLESSAVRDAAVAGEAVAAASAANMQSAGAHYIVQDSEDDSDDDEEAIAAR
eukprot:CAMPEP_0113485588 /NCGR_PEP_ID=MMETSP0014_2-20120614/24561_1 /TAXON_ID=2857 /ORGANISM="Nitzschia sp." /LENGTH=673 /DNA_ID=CAMNT_0000379239 /DNA_START=26 /DNA_END=2047 /DNA_ORIENTATION=+ /assembly_acc=CAM_ASM_000159